MGHYAVDFQCDVCGNLRCSCPPKPDPQAHWFMVNSGDFTVHRVSDYLEQNKTDPMCYMRVMTAQRYRTRKEAESAAETLFGGSVELLQNRLKTLRRKGRAKPWESK